MAKSKKNTGTGIFAVGAGSMLSDAEAERLRNEAEQLYGESLADWAAVQDSIRSAAVACYASCRGDISLCVDCIRGQLLRLQDVTAATIDRARGKVRGQVEGVLAEAMGEGYRLGIPFPTPEEIGATAAGIVVPPLVFGEVGTSPSAAPFTGEEFGSVESLADAAGLAYRSGLLTPPVPYAAIGAKEREIAGQSSPDASTGSPGGLNPGPAGNPTITVGPTVYTPNLPTKLPGDELPFIGPDTDTEFNAGTACFELGGRIICPGDSTITPGPAGPGGNPGDPNCPPDPLVGKQGNCPAGQTVAIIQNEVGGFPEYACKVSDGYYANCINPLTGGKADGTLGGVKGNANACNMESYLNHQIVKCDTPPTGGPTNPTPPTPNSPVCCPTDDPFKSLTVPGETCGESSTTLTTQPTEGGGSPTDTTLGPGTAGRPASGFLSTTDGGPIITPPIPGGPGNDGPDESCKINFNWTFPSPCDPKQTELYYGFFTATVEDWTGLVNDALNKSTAKLNDVVSTYVGTGYLAKFAIGLPLTIATTFIAGVYKLPLVLAAIIPAPKGCNLALWTATTMFKAIVGVFNHIFGIVPNNLNVATEQACALACPTGVLGAGEADSLYAQGVITADQWKFLLGLNNQCKDWHTFVVDSTKNIATIPEAIAMKRAGKIDATELKRQFDLKGVRDKSTQDAFWTITEAIPGLPDLVRMMVRDSFDDNIAQQYGYDDEFKDKYTDKAKEFADRIGVPENVMKWYWRAHWTLPSPGQLYEMLHRLRPDANVKAPDGTPVSVDADKVKKALQVNDIAPGWVNELMAISYHPTTRVDLRRQYEFELIDDAKLEAGIQDLGYSKEQAINYRKFFAEDAAPKRAKRKGQMSEATVTNLYLTDGITADRAKALFQKAGIKADYIEDRIAALDNRKRGEAAKRTVAKIKARYLSGAIDDNQFLDGMARAGVEQFRIQELLKEVKLQREFMNKEFAAQKLCKLVTQGLLNYDDYARRMQRLGYSAADAQLGLSSCIQDWQDKLLAELQKLAEKMTKEAKTAERVRRSNIKKGIRRAEELYPFKPEALPVRGTVSDEEAFVTARTGFPSVNVIEDI